MQNILMMSIGVGMLLGGLFAMRYGLKKSLWSKLQYLLYHMTVTPWRGLLAGTAAAALLQGSTVVTLITIGLVSAEYLSFKQGFGIILGANIGTCSTVQLLSLAIPEEYLLAALSIAFLAALVSRRLRFTAIAASGLITMFIGVSIISDSLGNMSYFNIILEYTSAAKHNPLYGILAGIIITLAFQSSSAATGVLMVMADDGLVDLTAAAYVIYGNNIGSCISSLFIGLSAPSLAAKRIAMSHILLNIIGVLVFLPFTGLLTKSAAVFTNDFASQVALMHTIFNVLSSLAALPVIEYYTRLIMFIVPSD